MKDYLQIRCHLPEGSHTLSGKFWSVSWGDPSGGHAKLSCKLSEREDPVRLILQPQMKWSTHSVRHMQGMEYAGIGVSKEL